VTGILPFRIWGASAGTVGAGSQRPPLLASDLYLAIADPCLVDGLSYRCRAGHDFTGCQVKATVVPGAGDAVAINNAV
jgi:hypothetical protein